MLEGIAIEVNKKPALRPLVPNGVSGVYGKEVA